MSLTQYTSSLYGKSPGPTYLNITGCRLPTYLHVPLCYESNRKKLIPEKREQSTTIPGNMKLLNLFKEVTVYYKKFGIDLKKFTGFQYDLEKLLENHKSLVKSNKSKGIDRLRQNYALMALHY